MNDLNDKLEFDNLINSKDDRKLLEFVAEQTYYTNKRCTEHTQRLCALETNIQPTSKKQVIGVGGISGIIGGAIVFIIEYFATRGKTGG